MIGMSQTRIDLSAAILGLHAQKKKLEIAIAELQSLNRGMHARRGPKFMGEAERQQVSPTNEALLGGLAPTEGRESVSLTRRGG